MGYSPWGRKELDITEGLSVPTHTHTRLLINALASRMAFKDLSLPSGLFRTCFLLTEELTQGPGKTFQPDEKNHRINAKLPSCSHKPP